MKSIIPYSFERFRRLIEPLMDNGPRAVALAGTYGNPYKKGDELSDLDLLFVFHPEDTLEILRRYMDFLHTHCSVTALHLGMHPQFGHLVNIYFTDNPLQWVDVGIMDTTFACNYLTCLPITVVKGDIPTCGIPPAPDSQVAHLAKKIAKAFMRRDKHLVAVYSYRYLQWAKIDASCNSRLEETIEKVTQDIAQRFPYMLNNLDPHNRMESDEEFGEVTDEFFL